MRKSKIYHKKNEISKTSNPKNKPSSNNVPKIIHEEKKDTVRLNKYIGESGYCSRREADKLIEKGAVKINNKVAIMGDKVSPNDKVYVNNKLISSTEDFVYLALNKPVGITCTTEHKIRGNIVDFIGHEKRIFPIGRLDKDSQGLIFLTNDGDIVNKILRAGNNHEKEYIVTVNKPITPEFIQKMSSGVPILDTVTKKCIVKREGKYVFKIILTQGLNRQIRRMCSYLGYEVTKLERIRIMNVSLGKLPIGKWRYLSAKELETINELTRGSVKTKEASEE